MKNIILGVSGSIAAYKAADIAGRFVKDGFSVDVVMTKAAMEFVNPLTFQTLTKNRVCTDVFEKTNFWEVEHISLAQKADVLLVAPASADVIGKIACGIADDMLTTVIMAVRSIPVFIAPAMNTNMYENPVVQENIAKLIRYGYFFIGPGEGRLACGNVGKGVLADVSEIVDTVEKRLAQP